MQVEIAAHPLEILAAPQKGIRLPLVLTRRLLTESDNSSLISTRLRVKDLRCALIEGKFVFGRSWDCIAPWEVGLPAGAKQAEVELEVTKIPSNGFLALRFTAESGAIVTYRAGNTKAFYPSIESDTVIYRLDFVNERRLRVLPVFDVETGRLLSEAEVADLCRGRLPNLTADEVQVRTPGPQTMQIQVQTDGYGFFGVNDKELCLPLTFVRVGDPTPAVQIQLVESFCGDSGDTLCNPHFPCCMDKKTVDLPPGFERSTVRLPVTRIPSNQYLAVRLHVVGLQGVPILLPTTPTVNPRVVGGWLVYKLDFVNDRRIQEPIVDAETGRVCSEEEVTRRWRTVPVAEVRMKSIKTSAIGVEGACCAPRRLTDAVRDAHWRLEEKKIAGQLSDLERRLIGALDTMTGPDLRVKIGLPAGAPVAVLDSILATLREGDRFVVRLTTVGEKLSPNDEIVILHS